MITLRRATVDDARRAFQNRQPLKCYYSMQTFGGLDEDGNVPSIAPDQLEELVFTGTLIYWSPETSAVVKHVNWLYTSTKGPYYEGMTDSGDFFYLEIEPDRQLGMKQIQVCFAPKNMLSTDCLDEIDVWVPE